MFVHLFLLKVSLGGHLHESSFPEEDEPVSTPPLELEELEEEVVLQTFSMQISPMSQSSLVRQLEEPLEEPPELLLEEEAPEELTEGRQVNLHGPSPADGQQET